jgi:hypothetical protein
VKIRHLVCLRRTLQALFLIFFLFLVIESRLPQDVYIDYSTAFSTDQDLRLEQPVTFFFQLDPLIGVSSLLSGYTLVKGFLWGAGILVLTILTYARKMHWRFGLSGPRNETIDPISAGVPCWGALRPGFLSRFLPGSMAGSIRSPIRDLSGRRARSRKRNF